jgi:hypothetical protein
MLIQEFPHAENRNAGITFQLPEMPIATHNEIGLTLDSAFDHAVIRRIGLYCIYACLRLNVPRSSLYDSLQARDFGVCEAELLAAQNTHDFIQDRRGDKELHFAKLREPEKFAWRAFEQ